MVYIISLLHPLCASLCYLWLIYATLNLALIVNVRGEMRVLSLLCLCLSRTQSRRIRWFWIFNCGSQMSMSLIGWKPLYRCDSFFHLPILLLNTIGDKEFSVYTESKTSIFYKKDVKRCPPFAIVVACCFEQFSFKHPSLLANIVNTCGGFVIIKPGLGLDLGKDAIKTTVYLG